MLFCFCVQSWRPERCHGDDATESKRFPISVHSSSLISKFCEEPRNRPWRLSKYFAHDVMAVEILQRPGKIGWPQVSSSVRRSSAIFCWDQVLSCSLMVRFRSLSAMLHSTGLFSRHRAESWSSLAAATSGLPAQFFRTDTYLQAVEKHKLSLFLVYPLRPNLSLYYKIFGMDSGTAFWVSCDRRSTWKPLPKWGYPNFLSWRSGVWGCWYMASITFSMNGLGAGSLVVITRLRRSHCLFLMSWEAGW